MPSVSDVWWHYRQQGVRGIFATLRENPAKAVTVFRDDPDHFYHLELSVYREDVLTFVRPLVTVPDETILENWHELRNGTLKRELEVQFARTDERPDSLHSNWRELLYLLVRLTEPELVVETGIYDGLSSAYILHALERNGAGTLISIDIDDTSVLPDDIPDAHAGWVVPERYQPRWDRRIGDSRELLPNVAGESTVDCFLHDSLHTEAHMSFEFETALEGMDDGGLLLADNVRFNDVFWEFSRAHLRTPVFWKNTTTSFDTDGEEVNDRLGAGIIDE